MKCANMMNSGIKNRDFLSHYFTVWRGFKASLCLDAWEEKQRTGHGVAAATTTYFLVAILVNHVRRILTPWAGQFMWYHAVEDMKFARSSPHYFLEESAGRCGDVWGIGMWICWWYAVDVVRRVVEGKVLGREGDGKVKGGGRSRVRGEEMVMDVCRVVYLAVCLAAVERAYVETCWVAAHVYAFTRLVFGSSIVDVQFLRDLLLNHRLQVLLQGGLILRWLYASLLPNITALARSVPLFIAAGLFHYVVWGGTAYLVRYSNKYFLVLQMSDMLVTFGWMGLAVLGYVVMRLEEYWRGLRVRS